MKAAGSLTLYLGYATAIATFSAAAVALGLFVCHSARQRIGSVTVLLLAMLGIASALIAVAKQHTTGLLNVMVLLGFAATAGFVLFSALNLVFMEPRTVLAAGHPLVAHRSAGIRRRPVIVFCGFVVALGSLFVAATPSLFDSFFTSRPLRAPQQGLGAVPYETVCPTSRPGQGAPSLQAAMLASLWIGRPGAGAVTGGCSSDAQHVEGTKLWWAPGFEQGGLVSVGVAARGRSPVLVLAPAASFVIARARDGTLRGVTPRSPVETGDFYLVDTVRGTFLLIRRSSAHRYTLVPPPLVEVWLALVRSRGWAWPVADPALRSFAIVDDRGVTVADAVCRGTLSCLLRTRDHAVRSTGARHVGLGEVLSVSP